MRRYAITKHTYYNDPYVLSLLAVYIAIFFCFYSLDRDVAQFFFSIPPESSLKQISTLLSIIGEGQWYIVPPLILYFFLRKHFSYAAQASLFIFTTSVISGIAVNILKIIFARPRPQMYLNEHLFQFEWFHSGYTFASFPSGHSTTAVGAWLALALIAPKYRWFFIFTGILIASSRIILTAHYVGDVIAGSYLGAVITILLYRIMIRPQQDKLTRAF